MHAHHLPESAEGQASELSLTPTCSWQSCARSMDRCDSTSPSCPSMLTLSAAWRSATSVALSSSTRMAWLS